MSAQRRIRWSKFNRRTFLALVRRGRKKKKEKVAREKINK